MTYQPDKALHPGLTVQRILDDVGMTQKSLSERTGLSEKHISQIINGEASISTDTALLLEYALDGSATFWLNLENNYQATKARITRLSKLKNESKLVKKYPYNELSRLDFVAESLKPTERVENLWKFFGVNSLEYVQSTEAVAYRKQNTPGIEKESLAAWLRCGELEAAKLQLPEYNANKLKEEATKDLKLIIAESTSDFFLLAQSALLQAGVALVCIPHFPHTKVSGASRWIGGNPVIQLSIRGKDSDKFWFTLFHEIGHVLKHGRKEAFLEFDDLHHTEKEAEADDYAQRTLIPEKQYRYFVAHYDFSEQAIRAFASNIQSQPGIVLGRLKHDSFVSFRHLPQLHSKLALSKDQHMKG